MCNLYSVTTNAEAVRRLFKVRRGGFGNFPPLPSIFPEQAAPIVLERDGERELTEMSWGFPPPPSGNRPVTNVRNLKSPFWRSALRSHRCLVPVSAFCEWKDTKPRKTPIWFRVRDVEAFSFAGIWRQTENGGVFAFLTTEANHIVGDIHPKAMPVLLAPDDFDQWMGEDMETALALARPFPDDRMEICQEGGREFRG